MEYTKILPKLFPFKNLEHETMMSIGVDMRCRVADFERGSVIISPDSDGRILGFVLKGECTAQIHHSGGEVTTLNTLNPYDCFGILSVFSSDEEFPTTVVAAKKSKILIIDADSFLETVKKHPSVGVNVIEFLSKKICFLNRRIATFSGRSVEEKLSHALLRRYNELGSTIPFSGTKMASMLGVGRASLYRALELLENEKLITKTQKSIEIIDPEGLERKFK